MLTPDRIQITRHAADKYRARIDDSLSVDEAFELLTTNASSAAPLKTKTPAGDEQWRLETPRPCILAIRRDNNRRSIAVIVTVLKVPDEDRAKLYTALDALGVQIKKRGAL